MCIQATPLDHVAFCFQKYKIFSIISPKARFRLPLPDGNVIFYIFEIRTAYTYRQWSHSILLYALYYISKDFSIPFSKFFKFFRKNFSFYYVYYKSGIVFRRYFFIYCSETLLNLFLSHRKRLFPKLFFHRAKIKIILLI